MTTIVMIGGMEVHLEPRPARLEYAPTGSFEVQNPNLLEIKEVIGGEAISKARLWKRCLVLAEKQVDPAPNGDDLEAALEMGEDLENREELFLWYLSVEKKATEIKRGLEVNLLNTAILRRLTGDDNLGLYREVVLIRERLERD